MGFAVFALRNACDMVMWQAMLRESAISGSDENKIAGDLNEEETQTPVEIPPIPVTVDCSIVGQIFISLLQAHTDNIERFTSRRVWNQ